MMSSEKKEIARFYDQNIVLLIKIRHTIFCDINIKFQIPFWLKKKKRQMLLDIFFYMYKVMPSGKLECRLGKIFRFFEVFVIRLILYIL